MQQCKEVILFYVLYFYQLQTYSCTKYEREYDLVLAHFPDRETRASRPKYLQPQSGSDEGK